MDSVSDKLRGDGERELVRFNVQAEEAKGSLRVFELCISSLLYSSRAYCGARLETVSPSPLLAMCMSLVTT